MQESSTQAAPRSTLLNDTEWSTHHIEYPKVGGGAIGQVRDDKAIRLAAVLVHHDDVCHAMAAARLNQLWQHLQQVQI